MAQSALAEYRNTQLRLLALKEQVQKDLDERLKALLGEYQQLDLRVPMWNHPRPASRIQKAKEELTCRYCNGRKGHDARAHRQQQPKRPFTVEELKAKGLA